MFKAFSPGIAYVCQMCLACARELRSFAQQQSGSL